MMGQALKLSPGTHHLRLTLAADPASGLEKIYAIELLESATSAPVEAAIWLERQGMPGAYFSLQGLDYERMLWQSPVQFSRISRGVGPSAVTIRRKVTVKSRKQGKPRTVVRTFRVKGQHIGIDFAAPTGTPVVAVADGEVIHADFNGGYGKLIIIDHGQGHHTYYAHLSAYASDIRPGTPVRRGETIGLVGSTGFSTGPHLHYEIRKQGQYIDPTLAHQKLQFWSLTEEEQPALLARLLMLQWAPKSGPALIEASRGASAQ
jgi:murein DD-endopeptidase MepM/ murein hydrolase activator NlpD